MNRLKSIAALVFVVSAFALSSCTQDDAMDDIMSNTEINSPSPTGDDSKGDEDPPTTP